MAFSTWVERSLSPKLSRITNAKGFQAFRNAFFGLMPLTIMGSVFMLVTDFPIPGWADLTNSLFGEGWMDLISPAYRATLNMLGLLFAGTFCHELGKNNKLDQLTLTVLGIVSYVVVAPKTVLAESGEVVGKVLSFTWTGTQGVMTAIVTSLITFFIFRFCVERNATIKMPKGVPPMVVNAFAAIIPGVAIITVLLLINGVCYVGFGISFPEAIFALLQAPLQAIIGAPFAIVLVGLLNGLFWWFGIHPTVVNSLIYPFLYANAASNQALADAGSLSAATGAFGSVQFLDQFLTIGGAGMAIGLAVSMVMVGRSKRMKAVSKVAIVPAFFEISEPMVFGVPLVFEPLMLVPMCLAPIVSAMTVIVSQSIGFMPMFTNIQAPWATPPLVGGFLVAGWQGAVVQLTLIVVSVAIYLPFTKELDKRFQGDEAKEAELEAQQG